MSFDDEWAQLQAAAVQRKQDSTNMQLNGLADNRSGQGNGTLSVSPEMLRGKASKVDDVRGNFKKADDGAMRETGQVKGSLKGFACADGFDAFEDRWTEQVSHLHGRLQRNSAALRKGATDFEESDKFPMGDGGDGSEGKGGKEQVAR